MSATQARILLPTGSIIGVSCNNEDHVRKAVQDGADYIGIGAVWGTQTKQLTSPLVGVRGVGALLEILDGTNVKAVAIGMCSLIRVFQLSSELFHIDRWYQIHEPSTYLARVCLPYEPLVGWRCDSFRYRSIA